MNSARSYFWRGIPAFSLVEVTIALGLLSFAVTTILALLPVGLITLRAAMDQSVEAQIVRSIGARSVVAGFSSLQTNGLYFDQEGQATQTSSEARYVVNIFTSGAEFPGSANALNLDAVATKMRIEVILRPAAGTPGTTNLHTLFVANSGN